MNFSTSYGLSRPVSIAAKVAAMQARLMPHGAPVAPVQKPAREGYRAKIQEWQIERADLRIQRAELLEYRQTSEIWAELERIESRLSDLNDFLIFEEDFKFDATPWGDYDEFDADLPDELDGSFSSFGAVVS